MDDQTQNTTPAPTVQKIVIVEDNADLANIYKTRLELIGYTCFIAYNGITGLYFIQKELPDLVLLDLMVPDIAGDQILLRMRSSNWGKNIPVYIISNLNEADAPAGLRELGISGYAVKANLMNDQIDQIVNGILRPGVPTPPPDATAPPIA
ncbi:MAG TPA: response regulator [Candidatus Saccharimonadales bacterium]|nr:response regulator [Candidatus Saccharimonadales bacterium]